MAHGVWPATFQAVNGYTADASCLCNGSKSGGSVVLRRIHGLASHYRRRRSSWPTNGNPVEPGRQSGPKKPAT